MGKALDMLLNDEKFMGFSWNVYPYHIIKQYLQRLCDHGEVVSFRSTIESLIATNKSLQNIAETSTNTAITTTNMAITATKEGFEAVKEATREAFSAYKTLAIANEKHSKEMKQLVEEHSKRKEQLVEKHSKENEQLVGENKDLRRELEIAQRKLAAFEFQQKLQQELNKSIEESGAKKSLVIMESSAPGHNIALFPPSHATSVMGTPIVQSTPTATRTKTDPPFAKHWPKPAWVQVGSSAAEEQKKQAMERNKKLVLNQKVFYYSQKERQMFVGKCVNYLTNFNESSKKLEHWEP